MDKENFTLALESLATSRGLEGEEREKFIKENIDYVLKRSYFHWNEDEAVKRYEFLSNER
jgi:hypothetical protein